MSAVRKHPFMFFGLPFLSIVVVSSFALKTFTQTRYDLNDQKVQAVTKEDELGMNKDRKKVDIREEYYVSDVERCETGAESGPPSTTVPATTSSGHLEPRADPAAPERTRIKPVVQRRSPRRCNLFSTCTAQEEVLPRAHLERRLRAHPRASARRRVRVGRRARCQSRRAHQGAEEGGPVGVRKRARVRPGEMTREREERGSTQHNTEHYN